MTSLRLLANNEGVSVPVSWLGKWKTTTMMLGISFLMANETWSVLPVIPIPLIGSILIYISGIISLWSALTYTLSMIAKLKLKRKR